jgi:ABC-type lipoprotein release transport system permease subunit
MNTKTWKDMKLAWRNLFRNKRRSFIAGTAIGIGLASLIFVDATIIGMKNNMIRSATASFMGEGQIHAEGFRQTQELDMTIHRSDQVLAQLKKESIVRHFAPRVMNFAMINSAADVGSVNLVGVEPGMEKYLSQVDDSMVKGSFFADGSDREILIGEKLADILDVGLNDRVVVTAAAAGTGDLSQDMLRVSGIFRLGIREMDSGMAFIRLGRAQKLYGLGNGIHEIALRFPNPSYGQDESLDFWARYSRYGNEAVGWTEILPQMKAALDLTDFSTYLIAFILFGVVALGIINTLFMSLHERMFEFGVLRAVGTKPLGLFRLIVFEAASLAVLSILIGLALGFALTYFTSRVGINYTGVEFAGVTFRELLYPVLRVGQFIEYPLWVFVFTVLAGIYPAVHAARMNPARAMRRSL